tara:strand:- start:316 stop:633 length:318 start_codon:yes stop_codon:yes gene_type:complete
MLNKINNQMEIYNYDKMGSLDKKSLELVWKAYNDNTNGNEDIFEIGFNTNSGYVYIALESGVQIASCFGQAVDFIVTDSEDGTEYFYDSYCQADLKLIRLNERVI